MKYIFGSMIAVVLIFGVSYLLAKLIIKRTGQNHRRIKIVIITVLIGCLLLVVCGCIYLGNGYHGDDKAEVAMLGNDNVSVSKIEGGYLFDGPSSTTAIIFYPGAKVDARAYAPLMMRLAEKCDCFLAVMPLNFALFGEDAADKFIDIYNYDSWLMAGHSMGGLVAANYAENHRDFIDGLVLLAAYSTTELDNDLKVYSIYGSEDGCLERDVYDQNKSNLPNSTQELVIEGGNHAQFGNYGKQTGDGTATISDEEQQRLTVEAVSELFKYMIK